MQMGSEKKINPQKLLFDNNRGVDMQKAHEETNKVTGDNRANRFGFEAPMILIEEMSQKMSRQ